MNKLLFTIILALITITGLGQPNNVKTVTIFKAAEHTNHYANGAVMTAF